MQIHRPRPRPSRHITVVAVAAALLLAFSSMAAADLVTNDIVDEGQTEPTIDVQAEILNIVAGANATAVTLSVHAQNEEPGNNICNLEGAGDNTLVLNIVNSNAGVARVIGPDAANPTLVRFTDCDSGAYTQTLTVTGLSAGTANITFTLNELLTSESATAGLRSWTFTTASFTVTVTNGGGAGGDTTYCDDPAAPAWANHILKANQKKNKKLTDTKVTNYVAAVAHKMGPGTDFDGIAKTSHPAYEQAVKAYLEGPLAVGSLPNWPTGWPPMSCTTVS